MKIIKQMKCEVQSKCQNDCIMCAHGEQRKLLPNYELSLSELQYFLDVSRDSGYRIDNMRIHGPGEPLLWRHFNDGVILMKQSGIIETIFVATNGIRLDSIDDDTWDCIDEMRVSVYSAFNRQEKLQKIVDKYPQKVRINMVETFRRLPLEGEEASIPCQCHCDGPMLIGNRVFSYCGPPVFGAAKLFGQDVFADPELSVIVGPNWLDSYASQKAGNLEYCKRCWANSNFAPTLNTTSHQVDGGRWGAVHARM